MNREEARLSVIGAISMALKNPTLQQGFEIICKNLAELEKENAELRTDSIEWEKASDKWKAVYELTNNQLTKAKDLLKWWVNHCGCHDLYYAKKTEQFIKDSEVEK